MKLHYHIVHKENMHFWGNRGDVKDKEIILHQRFGQKPTRPMLDGNTDNVWEDIDLRIYQDPSCESRQKNSRNEKARSKIPLKPKAPFKWFLMDIIPSTAPKSLTSDTHFLIVF